MAKKRYIHFGINQLYWGVPLFSPWDQPSNPTSKRKLLTKTPPRNWYQASRVNLLAVVVVEDRAKKDDIFHYDFISSDATSSPFWEPMTPLPKSQTRYDTSYSLQWN